MIENDSDANLWVKFFKRPVKLGAKSEREGRPCYEDRDFISIVVPGSQDETVREVRDADKERFPVQWARYVANAEQVIDGTPLEDWPALSASQREELKYFKVFTVEQMAGLTDGQLQKLGAGYMPLRDRAKAYLETARNSAAAESYAAENARLRQEIEALREEVRKLAADRKGRAA